MTSCSSISTALHGSKFENSGQETNKYRYNISPNKKNKQNDYMLLVKSSFSTALGSWSPHLHILKDKMTWKRTGNPYRMVYHLDPRPGYFPKVEKSTLWWFQPWKTIGHMRHFLHIAMNQASKITTDFQHIRLWPHLDHGQYFCRLIPVTPSSHGPDMIDNSNIDI